MKPLDAIKEAIEACKLHGEGMRTLPHEARSKLLQVLEEDKNQKVKLALESVAKEKAK